MEAYLDNSATTRPCEAATAAALACARTGFYNPSSLYAPALAVEKAMTEAREAVAARFAVDARQVIFTSCGTEADNQAIFSALEKRGKAGVVLYSAGEHPAVIQACAAAAKRFGHEAVAYPLTPEGLPDMDALSRLLDERTRLVCAMHVNNETGAVYPIAEIARLRNARCPDAPLHVDAVQSFLRYPLPLRALGVQTCAVSAHKVGGFKGTGALVVNPDWSVAPFLHGGGQERGLRSGTENTAGILAFGAAIRAYPAPEAALSTTRALKTRLLAALRAGMPEESLRVIGPAPDDERAAPYILCVAFRPVRSETMLQALAGDGVYVSNGSACSSRKQKVSGVLNAMRVPRETAEAAVRFSFSPENTEAEVDYAAERVLFHYDTLKRFARR